MVREFVVRWFAENGTLSQAELSEHMEDNYFDAGIIDSFGFLGLVSACEENFKILFSDDDFSKDEIFSIGGIIRMLEEKAGR